MRFSFIFSDFPQGAKFSLLTAFRFLGVFSYRRERETATERENQSERGQRQRERERDTRHSPEKTPHNARKRSTPTNYTPRTAQRPQRQNLKASRLAAWNLGTAHGLGTETENATRGNRFVNHSVNRNPQQSHEPICRETVGEICRIKL